MARRVHSKYRTVGLHDQSVHAGSCVIDGCDDKAFTAINVIHLRIGEGRDAIIFYAYVYGTSLSFIGGFVCSPTLRSGENGGYQMTAARVECRLVSVCEARCARAVISAAQVAARSAHGGQGEEGRDDVLATCCRDTRR